LQERQQVQQFRAQYMSVVSEAGVEGIEVLSDFIADTETDPMIRDWANKQRAKAREKIADLDKRVEEDQKTIKAAEDVADEATKKMKQAEQRLAALSSQAKDDRSKREAAERDAEAARRDLARAQTNVAINQARLNRNRDALAGKASLQTSAISASKAAQLRVMPR
jgi:chromosome segregation ATPase